MHSVRMSIYLNLNWPHVKRCLTKSSCIQNPFHAIHATKIIIYIVITIIQIAYFWYTLVSTNLTMHNIEFFLPVYQIIYGFVYTYPLNATELSKH